MYERLENETDDELIYRICKEKDVIGSWKDVADVINSLTGNNFDESSYRKRYQAFEKMFNANNKNFLSADARIAELKKAEESLRSERYKLQATKLEQMRSERQNSRFELFYENIKDMISALPQPEFRPLQVDDGKKEYLLTISDLHYGETYRSENNEYSREECVKRFERLLSQLIAYIGKNGISKMKILNLADNLHGILRLSDLQLNDTDVVMCVVEVSRIIANFLSRLSEFCEIDYYHVTASNHTQTRNLGSQASVLAGEDVEKIISNYIYDMVRGNERIRVIFDNKKEYLDFKIFNFNCTAEHGHRVKNKKDDLREKSILRHKIYDYEFIGHFHSPEVYVCGEEEHHNMELLVAPSIVGSCPYSDTLNVGAKSMAKMYIFDEKYGHIGDWNFILN